MDKVTTQDELHTLAVEVHDLRVTRDRLDLMLTRCDEAREQVIAERDELRIRNKNLVDGVRDLQERIIEGAYNLEEMANDVPHLERVRLLSKAQGLRVAYDYTRSLLATAGV